MRILINTQSFHNDYLYAEIKEISENKKLSKIFITSSLMNDLDEITINKYNKINKVEYIGSNSLFDMRTFTNQMFTLDKKSIYDSDNQFIHLLSSARWLPISKRNINDISSFTMVHYYDTINFWNNFFKCNKIDFIISLNDEHSSLDSILIQSAKQNNINNILTSSIVGAYAENSEEYFAFYDNNNNQYVNLNLSTDKITLEEEKLDTFSDEYIVTKKDKVIFAYKQLKSIVLQNTSIFIKLNILKIKVVNYLKTKYLLKQQQLYIKNLKRYYSYKSISNIDYGQKYIYYCLHFDPEATTLPKDTIYSNQLLNIRIIASSLPEGWKLYVKEHPHQLKSDLYENIFLNQLHTIDIFRSESFYEYINTLPNTYLLSLNSEHKKIIKNAQYIVSNTGTVFREAAYLGKRCITFSKKSLYSLSNNVYVVQDYDDCIQLFSSNPDILHQNIDDIFSKYSITIGNLNQRDVNLLKFIVKKILFRK